MSKEMDEYRAEVALMPLGELIDALIQLRMSNDPESTKEKITKTQKIREVVFQINQREVVDEEEASKPRRNKIGSLKSIL